MRSYEPDKLVNQTFREWWSPMLVLGTVFASCSTKDLAQFKAQLAQSECHQEADTAVRGQDRIGLLDRATIPTEVSAHFSPSSLHIAHAIGVLPMLGGHMQRLAVPSAQRTTDQRIALLEERRTLAHHLDLASLEISAVASELDCEEEKISQLAAHLDGIEDNAESRLTMAAIAVGALGAVVTGIHLADGDGNSDVDGIGIVFGIAEASLGAAIMVNHKQTNLSHPRNALRAVYDGLDPTGIFPPMVWYCLTQPVPGEAADRSLRQELLQRWRDAGTSGDGPADQDDAPFLGDGGLYGTDELKERAAMYDQLESTIKLVKQDLLQLVRELDALEQ